MGRGVFLGQPRYCVRANASRGLSAIEEFLVNRCNYGSKVKVKCAILLLGIGGVLICLSEAMSP